ncbi:MAG: hypothetical protein EOM15_01570 [Spirochaetia bacterium]|nr:hypothetical protein [Spirochaetia bacterium]
MNVIRCLFGTTPFALKAQDIDRFCSDYDDALLLFDVQRELNIQDVKSKNPVYAILKDGETALRLDALIDYREIPTEHLATLPAVLTTHISPILDRKVILSEDGLLMLVINTHAIVTMKEDAHGHFFN